MQGHEGGPTAPMWVTRAFGPRTRPSATGFAEGGPSGPRKAALATLRKGVTGMKKCAFVDFLRPQGVFVFFVVVFSN